EVSLGSYPSYLAQLDTWADPKSAFRIEQPVARQLPSCSFPASVKEENVCCMFTAEKRAKNAPEGALFPSPMPESCLGEHEVPVPSYYRAGQGYPALEKAQNCGNSAEFEAAFEARPSLSARSEHLEAAPPPPPPPPPAVERISPKFQGNFPENASAEQPQSEIKTEKSGAAGKGSAAEAEKELNKSTDTTSTDNSDSEAKGRRESLFISFIPAAEKREYSGNIPGIFGEYSGRRSLPCRLSPAEIGVKIWFQNRRMKLKKMNRENRIRELTSNFNFT
ncbi:HXC10 protein, partial [Pachycephala philippinensis]|nr:HXC10 protein [Pachycephala philippinensis]